MKPDEYIDHVVTEITDDALQQRLREELTEHWEDYSENADMKKTPKELFGDETLLVRQVNAAIQPSTFAADVALSIACGVGTMIFFVLLSGFLDLDLENLSVADRLLRIISAGIGVVLWCGIAGFLSLAFQRRMMIRYGESKRKMILYAIAFLAPVLLLGFEESLGGVFAAMQRESFVAAMWKLCSLLATLGILYGLFAIPKRLLVRNMTRTDQMYLWLQKHVPLVIAVMVTAGAVMLIVDDVVTTVNAEGFQVLVIPFTMPLLLLYLFWGMVSMSIGAVLNLLGLSVMFGFWASVMVAIFIGAVLPASFVIRRKAMPLAAKIAASVILPLMIIIPAVPHDVPSIEWRVPLVWNWDQLERTQLNVTYPWAASLMRRNDGMSMGYAAYVDGEQLIVMQGGGASYHVTRNGIPEIPSPGGSTSIFRGIMPDAYDPIPVGFTCDGKSLEEFIDTHMDTTAPLGMFGTGCDELAYHGKVIANISRNHGGALIDLDLAPDGLLAVSINMGSYDPTYVYVVDVSDVITE